MAPKLTEEQKYVLKRVEEDDITFVRFWFTDVLGFLKSFAVTPGELEAAFTEGMGFDGSSIQGFTRIQESDMVAIADAKTFAVLPWRPGTRGVGRMFCDVHRPDGKPFDGDPRNVLKRNLERAKKHGYTYYVGPELEFFYFADEKGTEVLDNGGYFDLTPLDVATDLRRNTIFALQKMGIDVEYSHHEVAPSQHEIDLRYTDALSMADNVMTYRLAVKEIAYENGVYATFMPKPIFGENGSGMHVHQSLFKGNRNAFFDPKSKLYGLSETAQQYIAGILKHGAEIALVTNQWVNSYKRLVPGYEAPIYLCWSQANRSALVRIPQYKPGKENATRIEVRNPDPSCNPYLAFSAMLAAGLEGIEKKYKLPTERGDNIFDMSDKERDDLGIETLPKDLNDAIEKAKNSKVLRKALGDHTFEYLIENKMKEWDEYKGVVHQWELDKYLSRL